MTTSTTGFDTSKLTFGEPCIFEGPRGKAKYIPIFYDGKKPKVLTAKCYCWGIQRDKLNTQKQSFKLPLAMSKKERHMTKEHTEFVHLFNEVVLKCAKHGQEKGAKLSSLGKLGSCLFPERGRDRSHSLCQTKI